MFVKLFVGNLPWSVRDKDLEDIFSPHGEVQTTRVVTERDTGRSRGFGFVEMEAASIESVVDATNGLMVQGREIRVNEAEDKGGGGGRRGGGGGRPPRRDFY